MEQTKRNRKKLNKILTKRTAYLIQIHRFIAYTMEVKT